MELMTSSRKKCFQRCQQEHHNKYVLLRRPRVKAHALGFGSLMHDGLEAWRLIIKESPRDDMDPDLPLIGALDAINALAEKARGGGGELDPFDFVAAGELMRGYHCRWLAHDTEQIEYLVVEGQFETRLMNPLTNHPSRTWRFAGKVDGIVRFFSTGHKWLVETKTSKADIRPGSDYWRRLQLDGQVSQYYDGSAALGHEIVGCIYDVIKKPGIQPLKATPEDRRKFTMGKGCKACGGSAGGKRGVVQGCGWLAPLVSVDGPPITDEILAALPDDKKTHCTDCDGSGWREAPRLSKTCREFDETLDEYRDRLRAHICADPEGYFQRVDVVRFDEDLLRYRLDTWRIAKSIREVTREGMPARNDDACVRYGRFCSYHSVCLGAADINDGTLFYTSSKHPELEVVA